MGVADVTAQLEDESLIRYLYYEISENALFAEMSSR